jgi:hypothetical protein
MTAEKNDKKIPYEKPQVSFVKFVVDEMVFTNCKLTTNASGGRNSGNACSYGGIWTQFSCREAGS